MGLDMYVWRVKSTDVVDQFTIAEDTENGGSKAEEIFYWRKHHDLHGWMENLYKSKGGTDVFNCRKVQLSLEDLDRLQRDVALNKLPQTQGFFFGDNPPDDESKARDLEFIELAKDIIRSGDAVYYDSWW